MLLNCQDTIAAIGTPQAPSLRGMIRVSGPKTIDCLAKCFSPDEGKFDWQAIRTAQRLTGTIHTDLQVDCALFLWPSERSYTRQPSGEIHTIGSPPLLDAILGELCDNGARLAEPGEFTLRAFLAGRIDLTQAEAVLGVIDARGERDFGAALQQLAGGLSKPLSGIRETLLALVAELEAGLDFVEEDIEFITQEQVLVQLSGAQQAIKEVGEQMSVRNVSGALPRVVLTGLPNAGKSSLFNALKERYGSQPQTTGAIISDQPGTTRDYLSATLVIDGLSCEVVDTAGIDPTAVAGSIGQAAQAMTSAQHAQADLEIQCIDATTLSQNMGVGRREGAIVLLTKDDLRPAGRADVLGCSSKTGHGLEELGRQVFAALSSDEECAGHVVYPTALRCAASLAAAEASLARALALAAGNGGEEFIAAEVRGALNELGEVIGVVYTDDILDRIFGQFCIGK